MSKEPPRAFVVGWPIAHSRSPIIHGYWLAEHGLAGSYQRLPVPPDEFPGFIRSFAEKGFVGGNVTVPHKEAAFAALDLSDDIAATLGAANTVWREAGRLCGSNTDVIGFLANLDAEAPGWDEKPRSAIVLGAGGAARAVVYALISRGFGPIRIANRTLSRIDDFKARFGAVVEAVPWPNRSAALEGAALLVNTTVLGMEGGEPLDIDLDPLPPEALVTDIVYMPLETGLLAAARTRGNAAVDGLGMLLHQAVPGFERWFGIRPAVTPGLRAAILADMGH